jgi:hypothetical protein
MLVSPVRFHAAVQKDDRTKSARGMIENAPARRGCTLACIVNPLREEEPCKISGYLSNLSRLIQVKGDHE